MGHFFSKPKINKEVAAANSRESSDFDDIERQLATMRQRELAEQRKMTPEERDEMRKAAVNRRNQTRVFSGSSLS